jgi:parvulin-like peptidyl-prolyl isomerase
VKRTFALLAAVISAAALLSGCSGTDGAIAGRVNSATISRKSFNDQLQAISKNTAWTKSIAANVGVAKVSLPHDAVSAKFATAWLQSLMNQLVIDQQFQRRHLTVTAADKTAAAKAATALFSTDKGDTFKTFPKWFRDGYLARQGRYEAVKRSLPNPAPTDALLQQYLEHARLSYCPTGNAVSHILVKTKAEADAIEASLAQGGDYAALAKENTLDTGTGAVGGFLTCTGSPNFAGLPAEIKNAVPAIPLGGISAPVESQYGFSIIRVTAWDVASVRPFAESYYQQTAPNPMLLLANKGLLKSKTWIDPRYGTVIRHPTTVEIKAPVAPTPKSKPRNPPSTTSTTSAGAAGQ